MGMALLVYTSEKIESFLEVEPLKIFFISVLSSFDPHDSLLLKPSINLIIPVLLIINRIDTMHLSVANHIRVCLVIVEVLVVNTAQDFRALDGIVNFVLDPLLGLKVKKSEIVE